MAERLLLKNLDLGGNAVQKVPVATVATGLPLSAHMQ